MVRLSSDYLPIQLFRIHALLHQLRVLCRNEFETSESITRSVFNQKVTPTTHALHHHALQVPHECKHQLR